MKVESVLLSRHVFVTSDGGSSGGRGGDGDGGD